MKAEDRLLSHVEINPATDCWEWRANNNPDGYGRFGWQGRLWLAHRAAYELFVGKIPTGLEIDHLCSNRGCVNPKHLQVVTRQENMARSRAGHHETKKTHCPQGHAYSGDNLVVLNTGHRRCRACLRAQRTAWKQKRKVEIAVLRRHDWELRA